MEIKEEDRIGICYFCKKRFEKCFGIDFDRRFFNTMKICRQCARSLYNDLGKCLVPKSPKNINANLKLNKK